jgi:ribosomal protein L29
MAVLRAKDIFKMQKSERDVKLKELQFELTKAHVTSNKSKAKTKEIKKAIARLLTINKSTTLKKEDMLKKKNK